MTQQLIEDIEKILNISLEIQTDHPDPAIRKEMKELVLSFNAAVAKQDIKTLASEMNKSILFTLHNHHDITKRRQVAAIRSRIGHSLLGYMFRLK